MVPIFPQFSSMGHREEIFYHNLIVSPSHGPAGTRILNLCRCLQLRVIRVCVRSSTRRACISHTPSTHIAHSTLLQFFRRRNCTRRDHARRRLRRHQISAKLSLASERAGRLESELAPRVQVRLRFMPQPRRDRRRTGRTCADNECSTRRNPTDRPSHT